MLPREQAVAAVGHDYLAGDPGGVRAAQQRDRPGDVLRLPQPPERRIPSHSVQPLGCVRERPHCVGVDQARRDRVDPDATGPELDRQIAQWRKRYPDLDVETMAVHGTTLKHLTDKAGSIQLLVVGHERARGIKDLIVPPGYASLHETACSVLVCEPQNVL